MTCVELGRSQEVISLWEWKLVKSLKRKWRTPYYDLHRIKVITGGLFSMKMETEESIYFKTIQKNMYDNISP